MACRALSEKQEITPETGPLNSWSFSICGSPPPSCKGTTRQGSRWPLMVQSSRFWGVARVSEVPEMRYRALEELMTLVEVPRCMPRCCSTFGLMMWHGRETVFSGGCFYPPTPTLEDVFTSLASCLSLRTGCLQGRVV